MLRTGYFAVLFAFLFLAGCDNPTSVGLPLIGEEGGRPSIHEVAAESAATAELNGLTGNRSRFLSGRVDDPLLGSVAADGYVDLFTLDVQDGFREGNISEAVLELPLDYVYGDTLSDLTLQLFDMASEWDSEGVLADTTLSAGQAITITGDESGFHPTDSLLRITLPGGWIARHEAALQSEEFDESFHGFKVEVSGGNAVVGFRAAGVRLTAVAGADTATFSTIPVSEITVQKTLTTLTREEDPAIVMDNSLPVQLLVGPTVRFSLPLPDSLMQNSLNQASIVVYSDTAGSPPANFARPAISELRLVGVTDSNEEIQLATALRNDDGLFVFESRGLHNVLQAQLLEDFDRFMFYKLEGSPGEPPTINGLQIYNTAAEGQAPLLLLTLTRVD